MTKTELPQKLKSLYRHWRYHTKGGRARGQQAERLLKTKLFKEIEVFIQERMNIWKKKTEGAKPPYTKDKVLANFRFTNMFRELDRQTIEIHTLLNPLRDNFALWLLNMFYCRMVARTETVEYAGLLSFNSRHNAIVYKRLMKSPRPRFGSPYVFPISVIQRSSTPTRELFITKYLPRTIRKIAKEIETWEKESVYNGVEKILPIFGYNLRFHWTEVLIDMAYQYPQRINLFERFPVGPGALPTFKKIGPDREPSLLAQDLASLNLITNLTYEGKPLVLSAENWEGVGCEFRKYTNLKKGLGRRRIYRKHQGS